MSEQTNNQELLDTEVPESEETSSVERCLTFDSGDLVLYISTKYVIEIINNHAITTLPLMPPYIKGIINLRGQTIPIIDIRLRMGKMPQDYTDATCIIILEIKDISVGIVVDSVTQVLDIDLDRISPIPTQNQQELTSSMISREDGSVILFLDCEELISQ